MPEPAKKDDDQLSPFERFKKFARAIVAVPKAEVDEQEERYKRRRESQKSRPTVNSGKV